MNTYVALHVKHPKTFVEADTSRAAQVKAAAQLGVKPHEVTVHLVAKNGVASPISTASL